MIVFFGNLEFTPLCPSQQESMLFDLDVYILCREAGELGFQDEGVICFIDVHRWTPSIHIPPLSFGHSDSLERVENATHGVRYRHEVAKGVPAR